MFVGFELKGKETGGGGETGRMSEVIGEVGGGCWWWRSTGVKEEYNKFKVPGDNFSGGTGLGMKVARIQSIWVEKWIIYKEIWLCRFVFLSM